MEYCNYINSLGAGVNYWLDRERLSRPTDEEGYVNAECLKISLNGETLKLLNPLANRMVNLELLLGVGRFRLNALECVSKFPNLTHLGLKSYTGKTVAPLANLKKLKKLDIDCNNAFDLEHIFNLPELEALSFSTKAVYVGSELQKIEPNPKLKALTIQFTGKKGDMFCRDLTWLSKFPNLEVLTLYPGKNKDFFLLDDFKYASGLKYLKFYSNDWSDSCLKELGQRYKIHVWGGD